jgi:hypothetical protein
MVILYPQNGFTDDTRQEKENASNAFADGSFTCHGACRLHTLSCTSTVGHAAVSKSSGTFQAGDHEVLSRRKIPGRHYLMFVFLAAQGRLHQEGVTVSDFAIGRWR